MKKVLYMALAAALLCSCGKNSDPEKPVDKPNPSVVPAPPEEIISNNTFVVDYFTDMKDSESYFSKRDVNVAKEYILGDAGKNSVMFFFDRMDFTVGKTSPAVKMCTAGSKRKRCHQRMRNHHQDIDFRLRRPL